MTAAITATQVAVAPVAGLAVAIVFRRMWPFYAAIAFTVLGAAVGVK